jgi:serine/threonine protein kinase
MICPACRSEIPDRAKFCLECGSNLSALSGVESPPGPAAPANQHASRPTTQGSNAGSAVSAQAIGSIGDRRTIGAFASPISALESSLSFAGIPLAERYEVLGELGRGGFGVVYQARDRKLGRLVAIKRLLVSEETGLADRMTLERFIREARTIAALNHRHIVQVFDHDRDQEGHYIVMEYIDGGTLARYLSTRGRLRVEEAVPLVRGIAQGLGFAHRRNLVHRDVKPANILLLDEQGTLVPKIVDFGLARGGGGIDVSVSGYGLGTPYYMSPEQRRDAKNVNHTSDIYALGKTLYELVTGEIPDNVDPDLIPEPAALSRIIFRCLKTNPADRYFSMEELAAELEQLDRKPAAPTSVPAAPPAAGESANSCVQCGTLNGENEKYCFQCGTPLFKTCPECDRENGARVKFCGSCGTEIDAFATIRNAVTSMEEFRRQKKWSELLKEAELAPGSARLPGKNGSQLARTLQRLRQQAQEQTAERDRLRAEIMQSLRQPEFQAADVLRLVAQFQAIDPHDTEINGLVEPLTAQAADQKEASEWQALMNRVQQLEVDRDYPAALKLLEKFRADYQTGKHAEAAGRETRRVGQLLLQKRLDSAIRQRNLDEARELVEEFSSQGATTREVQNYRGRISRLELDLLQQRLDQALKHEQLDEARRLLEKLRRRAKEQDAADAYEQAVYEQAIKRLAAHQAFKQAFDEIRSLEQAQRFSEAADRLKSHLAENPLAVSLGLVDANYLSGLRRSAAALEFVAVKADVLAGIKEREFDPAFRRLDGFLEKYDHDSNVVGADPLALLATIDKAFFDDCASRAKTAEEQHQYVAAIDRLSQYLQRLPNGQHLARAQSELERLQHKRRHWEEHGKQAAFAAEEAKRLIEMADYCRRAGNPDRANELMKKARALSHAGSTESRHPEQKTQLKTKKKK